MRVSHGNDRINRKRTWLRHAAKGSKRYFHIECSAPADLECLPAYRSKILRTCILYRWCCALGTSKQYSIYLHAGCQLHNHRHRVQRKMSVGKGISKEQPRSFCKLDHHTFPSRVIPRRTACLHILNRRGQAFASLDRWLRCYWPLVPLQGFVPLLCSSRGEDQLTTVNV